MVINFCIIDTGAAIPEAPAAAAPEGLRGDVVGADRAHPQLNFHGTQCCAYHATFSEKFCYLATDTIPFKDHSRSYSADRLVSAGPVANYSGNNAARHSNRSAQPPHLANGAAPGHGQLSRAMTSDESHATQNVMKSCKGCRFHLCSPSM